MSLTDRVAGLLRRRPVLSEQVATSRLGYSVPRRFDVSPQSSPVNETRPVGLEAVGAREAQGQSEVTAGGKSTC